MNKKAQLDDLMTWSVAFIVIFFIMLLFIGGVAGLFTQGVLKKSTLSISSSSNELFDERDFKLLQEFANENSALISDWADFNKGEKEIKKKANALFNKLEGVNLERNFKLTTEDREFKVIKGEDLGALVDDTNAIPNERVNSKDRKLIMISKGGNIVILHYNDKTIK